MVYLILGISILLCVYGIYSLKKSNSISIQKRVQQEQANQLAIKIESKKNQLKTTEEFLNKLELRAKQIKIEIDQSVKNQQKEVSNKLDQFKKVTKQAANTYVETLQAEYKRAEAAHAENLTRLSAEWDEAAAALNNLKETRRAAYQAVLKEEQIRQNKDNYRLLPSKLELEDIYTLQNIKKGLHKPRILSMLIWQTFWQPLAKQRFPIILQAKTKIGIYKITNIRTEECYIGQSLDIYKRWCQHCKAGLGIDTPVGNKLYKAIQKDGLQNFTFELIIECSKEQLNEKEKYFIELYQSDTYGYNGTGGNKK